MWGRFAYLLFIIWKHTAQVWPCPSLSNTEKPRQAFISRSQALACSGRFNVIHWTWKVYILYSTVIRWWCIISKCWLFGWGCNLMPLVCSWMPFSLSVPLFLSVPDCSSLKPLLLYRLLDRLPGSSKEGCDSHLCSLRGHFWRNKCRRDRCRPPHGLGRCQKAPRSETHRSQIWTGLQVNIKPPHTQLVESAAKQNVYSFILKVSHWFLSLFFPPHVLFPPLPVSFPVPTTGLVLQVTRLWRTRWSRNSKSTAWNPGPMSTLLRLTTPQLLAPTVLFSRAGGRSVQRASCPTAPMEQ